MKLVHPEISGQIVLNSTKPCQWVIESPAYLTKLVQELCTQAEGKEGNFVLSAEDKEYDISKYAEIVINPFAVNMNDKKILNRLYAELSEIAYREDSYLITQETLGRLQNYFIQIEQASPYILSIDEDIDMSALWKTLGVKFENYAENFLEKLGQYIKIMAELMKKKVIVFINLGSYLDKEQIMQLIELAKYNEIALLFIENSEKDFSDEVIRYIIDKDGCEIY